MPGLLKTFPPKQVMPTMKLAPLPEPLRYLQPIANALAKLPPEDLNDDVDASRLEAALRKRVSDMDEETAEAELSKDRDLLERWLKDKPDHPAHWIIGFLHSSDLATHLTQPPEPPPRGPEMSFDAPEGWKVKVVPFRLDVKQGKLIGTIMAIDESSFDLMQRQKEHWVAPPGLEATHEVQAVRHGDVSGKKYIYRQIAPVPWKRVDYVLSVPGGFVSAMLDALGSEFDEAPFEDKLHTVRLSAST
jgi:hypothetical protein